MLKTEAKPAPFRRMKRRVSPYDLSRFSPNALEEGFVRGAYKLPRQVRRFLRRPLSAYAGRPKLQASIQMLAEIIGRYHTGERNFVGRGLGVGPEGTGFFLARDGLAAWFERQMHSEACDSRFADPADLGKPFFTAARIRLAIKFLIEIGFIERITPEGDLVEVRAPKNAVCPGVQRDGYFRRVVKITKDRFGQIRAAKVYYRLGSVARSLFSKTLRRAEVRGQEFVQEPVWMRPEKISSTDAVTPVQGIHTGSAPYDRCGHDPDDPRFDYHRPDPFRDPHRGGTVRTVDRWAATQAVVKRQTSEEFERAKAEAAAELKARERRRLADPTSPMFLYLPGVRR